MTPKTFHEIRDPIHVFITLDSDERDVLDSRPIQRLRHIHQLAMEYLVYPGATHKRFEHALGVMELASRVFDIITRNENTVDEVRRVVPELSNEDQKRYWRRVLRMAALCHDIGHLPFSHAAEDELLPDGWTHETMTKELILSPEMQQIWNRITPPLRAEDIVKLSVGPAKYREATFSNWEAILSEIVVSDAFGVDRMDYLLRDSLHAGVQYGKFDHYRLIDTLRILPSGPGSDEPTLGLEDGGVQSAEALLLARYSMFTQVYLHPVRRAYDFHLKDFLRQWLPNGVFTTVADEFLNLTDVEVLAEIHKAARTGGAGQEPSLAIANRQHFKTVYSRNTADLQVNDEPGRAIFERLVEEFGEGFVHWDNYVPTGQPFQFPVQKFDGEVVSSLDVSDLLSRIPPTAIDFVFVSPDIRDQALRLVNENKHSILTSNV